MHRVGGHPIPYSTILYTTTNHAIPTNDTKAYYHTICHAKSWKSFLPYSTIVYTTKNHTSAHNKTSPWYSIQFSMTQDMGVILTNIQYNKHSVEPTFGTTKFQYDTGQEVILTNILGPDSHLHQTPLLEKSSPISCVWNGGDLKRRNTCFRLILKNGPAFAKGLSNKYKWNVSI